MADRARQHQALPGLFDEIRRAREALRYARHLGGPAAVARGSERQLYTALNEYAMALGELSLPVPGCIRDELRMYHDLLAAYRGPP